MRRLVLKLLSVHGMSQRQLARRCGWSEGMVSKLVTGAQQDVTVEQARKLVAAFGVNPREILE